MWRIGLLIILTVIFFFLEYMLFDFLGRWFKPNLLILLVIFFNVALGTRFGLYTALGAGILKDSFSTGPFGVYLISFVLCNYVVTLVKKFFFYEVRSGVLRILLAFVFSVLHGVLVYLFYSLREGVDFYEAWVFIILPEVVVTTLLSPYIFDRLKPCVLKLSR